MADQGTYEAVVAKALSNVDYYDELVAHPKETLTAAGFKFPDDVVVTVVKDEPHVMHFVLPLNRDGEGDNWIC